MEPVMFIIAILGCGESDAPCREVAVAEARYASEAACLEATESVLLRHDDLPYPTVVAQCRPAGARPQLLRGSEVRLPQPDADRQTRPRYADAKPDDRRR